MTEPSIRGCLRKLRLNSRRELTDSFRLTTRARTAAAQRRKIQGFGPEDKYLADAADRHLGVRLPALAEGGLLPRRPSRAPRARLVRGAISHRRAQQSLLSDCPSRPRWSGGGTRCRRRSCSRSKPAVSSPTHSGLRDSGPALAELEARAALLGEKRGPVAVPASAHLSPRPSPTRQLRRAARSGPAVGDGIPPSELASTGGLRRPRATRRGPLHSDRWPGVSRSRGHRPVRLPAVSRRPWPGRWVRGRGAPRVGRDGCAACAARASTPTSTSTTTGMATPCATRNR